MPTWRPSIGLLVIGSLGGAAVLGTGDWAQPLAVAEVEVDSIASPAGPGSAEPNLATGSGGEVHMTWLEPADSGFALRFATLAGGRWSAPATIRSGRDFFVNWADFPSIEVVGKNRLAVHWLQRNGTSSYAYGARIAQSADGGKTWGTPVIPYRDTTLQEHGFVAMWRDRDKMGAVWLDGRKFQHGSHEAGNEMMLVTTTIAANGTLGAEIILDDRTCDCCQNTVAMTSAGPIVAYRNRSTDEIRDIYVTRRVNEKWTTGVPVSDDKWKIAACPVNGPSLAASGNRVALAWFTGARDTARVNIAFSTDAGAHFSKAIRLDGGNPAGRVDVVLLPDGSALISWIERTGGDTAAVRVRRVTPAGQLGPSVVVAASSAARASGSPKMVLAGSQVVFAWTVPGQPSMIRVARVRASDFK